MDASLTSSPPHCKSSSQMGTAARALRSLNERSSSSSSLSVRCQYFNGRPKPSWRHATVASRRSKPSSQTEPQAATVRLGGAGGLPVPPGGSPRIIFSRIRLSRDRLNDDETWDE